jgi:integrase
VGSRESAFAAKREIETEIARGTFRLKSKSETYTFEAFAERWMERHVRPNLRPRSVTNYESVLLHINRRFGKISVEDITRPAVRDFIEGLVVEGKLARRTVQNIAAVMSSCLGYGVEMEVLQTNVAVRMKKLAKPEGPGKGVRALPLEELRALLAAAREHTPPSFHAFLMCAATTGMRAGELRALRWSDVDLTDGSIVVSKSAAVRLRDPDGPTKGGKPRTVYMPEEFRKVMVEHRRRLPEEALKKRWGAVPEYVFPSTTGGMMNDCSYRRWIEKAAEKAGIERTRLHNLRHTAISLLLNNGADPFAVQKLAGHSNVRLTTQTYAHVQAEALRRAVGVLDQFDLEKKGVEEIPVNTTAG